MNNKNKIELRELIHIKELSTIYPLIKQLNPKLGKKQFEGYLRDMVAQGYRCVAAYDKGNLIGVCGFWFGVRFWCGPFIDLDNVVVDQKIRSKGIGKKLVAWVEKEAKRVGCTQVGLDSYTISQSAHRFYFREGYSILGYHFVKKL